MTCDMVRLLQFLLWCLSIQKSRQAAMSPGFPGSPLDFATETSDLNHSTTRKRLLFSRGSRKYIRIQGRIIDARGENDDPHARLILRTVNVNEIVIQGEKSKHYLCISSKGDLVGRRKLKDGGISCVFTEYVGRSQWTEIRSVQHTEWYIGFKSNGDPKKAHRSRPGQKATQFLDLPPDDEVDNNQRRFEEFLNYFMEEFTNSRNYGTSNR